MLHNFSALSWGICSSCFVIPLNGIIFLQHRAHVHGLQVASACVTSRFKAALFCDMSLEGVLEAFKL